MNEVGDFRECFLGNYISIKHDTKNNQNKEKNKQHGMKWMSIYKGSKGK